VCIKRQKLKTQG